jgi:hypothetical protein
LVGCGGQIVSIIPLANKVAPWLARRCGTLGSDLSRHAMNVEFYQLSGTISGFWTGLLLPLKILDMDL